MRLLAATLLSAALACANDVQASDLSLAWQAPAGCPGLAELQAGLAARQRHSVALGANAPIRIEATVTRSGPGFQLDLRTRTEIGEEQRQLRARSCNELARATVLLASLLLSTPPAAAAQGQPAQTDSARPSSRAHSGLLHVAVSAVLDMGRLAAVSAGVAAQVGADLGALRVRAGALYLPTRNTPIADEPGASLSLRLLAAELSACYAIARTPWLAPCLFGELGSLGAAGHGLAHNEQGTSLWLLGGLGLQLGWRLLHWLSIDAELTLGAPLVRTQLSVRDVGHVYRVPALAGQLRAGLTFYFP